MIDPDEQLVLLRQCCPGAVLWDEAGGKVAYLPDFEFSHLGEEKRLNLLLIPFAHSGYQSRLFFSEPLAISPDGRAPVWTTPTAIGQSWHAPSVQGVNVDQPWLQMVASFLRAIG